MGARKFLHTITISCDHCAAEIVGNDGEQMGALWSRAAAEGWQRGLFGGFVCNWLYGCKSCGLPKEVAK